MGFFAKCGVVPALLAALLSGCAASTSDIPAVGDFELDRYLGTWYEIARLPHRFERGLENVRAEYSLNPDGTVKVVNRGVRDGGERTVTGRAKFKDPAAVRKGELRVSFFRPFYGDYRIIELGPGYDYAVVTGATRDYLWILSRSPKMPAAQLKAIVDRLAKLGFEVDQLEYPRQDAPEKR